MRFKFTLIRRRVLSSLFTNLAAGWIGATIIVPNFSTIETIQGQLTLTFNIVGGIICLLFAFKLEERVKKK